MSKKPKKPDNPDESFRDADPDSYAVDAIHQRIVSREQEEPEEGFEKPPAWVWVSSVLILFAMGYYLGRYSGSWSTVAHEVESPATATGAPVKRVVKGEQVYIAVCQTCHQANGAGVAGQYPPLTGSEWLTQDAETPIRVVLYGLEGPITVHGTAYDNKMPGFHDKLSDDEIAAVLTHARSSFGNTAPPVAPEDVAAVRSAQGVRTPWSASELSTLRMKK